MSSELSLEEIDKQLLEMQIQRNQMAFHSFLKSKLQLHKIVQFCSILVFLLAGAAFYQLSVSTRQLIAFQTIQKSQSSLSVPDKVRVILFIDDAATPSVLVVTDANQVRTSNPSFYKNAENGDSLLVYSNQAVIYREKNNQIINVTPINKASK